MAAVEVHRADDAAQAYHLMRDLPGARYVAGGIDVVNGLKAGSGCRHLIMLDRIPGFDDVAADHRAVMIGAGATHHTLATSPMIREALPSVAAFIAGLGNIRIRVQGTLAGNVMAREPAYEGLSLLQALGAVLIVATAQGLTEIPAAQFDPITMPPGGLITRIEVPRGRTLLWDRGLRPLMGLVLGMDGRGSARGTASLNGIHRRSVAWALPPAGTAEEIGRDFAHRLPAPDVAIETAYMRRAAAILLRRLLIRAAV